MGKHADIIDDARRADAEREIKAKQSEVKYDLRDFTVGYLVTEFNEDRFYVPAYQRKFIWTDKHRYRFIESIMLGMPIPMMFVADMEDGRLEIVDGAQRIQTLESFKSNDLTLEKLERLPSLNGFRFDNLTVSQQRKFDNKALRLVVLEDSTSAETRQEIFDRVNTSGMRAKPSEIRRGAHQGSFMNFLTDCANNDLFIQLCPIGDTVRKRYEHEELALRFFAYSENYKKFRHAVERFLNQFLKTHCDCFDQQRMTSEFTDMLTFVKKYFPYGFAKGKKAKTTPRVRFEAISVGVNLALRRCPDLVPKDTRKWIESEEFEKKTRTHASNSLPRLKSRIEFVRDQLLGKEG